MEEPRIRFFLEHKDLIRAWAALADEFHDAAAHALREVGVGIESTLPSDVLVGRRVQGGQEYGPTLCRGRWVGRDFVDPDVGISIGWDGKVDPGGDWPRTVLPYLGITTSREDRGLLILSHIRALPKEAFCRWYRRGSQWPAYKFLRAELDWWQDVPRWRERVQAELRGAWTRWAPVIDVALELVDGRRP